MGQRVAMTGNIAMANAMRQINPDVCAAYPITPSTEIMQQFSSFVADGLVKTVLVPAESEHSAMSACIGAAAAGGRVMTATSSQGLALMWEMLFIAAGNRLPIVLAMANRALSAPINIHGDTSDAMGARDSGWIQIFSENGQEAYDNLIQAVRIAEHLDIRLPVMVGMDGFIISHSIESMELLDDEKVRDFVGEYTPSRPLLDIQHPRTYGPLDLQDYYIEHKRQEYEAMKNAKSVILEVAKDFSNRFGREYGLFEAYHLDDAEVAIVVLNSAAGTVKTVIEELRADGVKAGLLKPRVFRPFPAEEIAAALSGVKAVCVMDRADGVNAVGGPLFPEFRSALYDATPRPMIINKVFGLGGRDLGLHHVREVFAELGKIAETGKIETLAEYITVRN
ncbi:MAG: pyruvate ferredoxin oxidoreductase [Deltaproteobacteria bacterium]|nr:pyruvate ferredoxin oxidoreductase [Deltaproteobacteria bacterium]